MLNYVTDNGGANQNINGPQANTGAQILTGMIDDTRSWLQNLTLSKTLPVGTSDAGSYFNNEVLAKIDYGVRPQRVCEHFARSLNGRGQLANVHAWFADVTADQASGWVANFFQNTNIAEAQAVPNQPKMFIAETGWPTVSAATILACKWTDH